MATRSGQRAAYLREKRGEAKVPKMQDLSMETLFGLIEDKLDRAERQVRALEVSLGEVKDQRKRLERRLLAREEEVKRLEREFMWREKRGSYYYD